MTAKAKLTIILKANETVVAEVENPILWQQVLGVIHNETALTTLPSLKTESVIEEVKNNDSDVMQRFAKKIGVSAEEVEGALSPSLVEPYLHLDAHCWSAMKKNTPTRGPGALSPTALAGTLLALWFKETDLGTPTQINAREVLKTVDVLDPNPSRGVKNSKWLQGRAGGTIVLNPAEIETAISITRSFCNKNWGSSN